MRRLQTRVYHVLGTTGQVVKEEGIRGGMTGDEAERQAWASSCNTSKAMLRNLDFILRNEKLLGCLGRDMI